MSELTSKQRNDLPAHEFVFPHTRRYPIHDKAHAENALARVSQNGNPSEKEAVHAAVYRRYPEIAHAHAMVHAMKKAHTDHKYKEGSGYEEKHESKIEAKREGD